MNIVEKIKSIYSQLSDNDFSPHGTIMVQDNSDGKPPYIAKWEHPTLSKPSDEQLGEIQ
jgi:hypothetical protein